MFRDMDVIPVAAVCAFRVSPDRIRKSAGRRTLQVGRVGALAVALGVGTGLGSLGLAIGSDCSR